MPPNSDLTCPKCSEKFRDLKTLSNHLHYYCDVEKPFKCDHCEYRSKWKSNLKTHVLHRHHRPKDALGSYRCEKCQKRYHHRHSLLNHMRMECLGKVLGRPRSSKMKFTCSHCEFECYEMDELFSHYKKKHAYTDWKRSAILSGNNSHN